MESRENEGKSCVFVCPSSEWGGVEKNVLVRASHFSKKGYKVYVILLKGLYKERFKDYPEINLINIKQRGGDINIFVLLHYVRLFKKLKPDVVFVASKKDWYLASFGAKLAGVERTILYLGIKRKIKKKLKYFFVFKVLKPIVLVNSESLKQDLIRQANYFSDKNVVRIYNGFNIPNRNTETIDLKAKFNLPDNTFIIGCCGRFSYQKGYDRLPEILSYLPKNFHVIHAGQGEHEEEIKAKINNSLQANRVHYMGYLKDTQPFLKSIDLLLLCSRNEGMANVLNEAMSHGKPVVSTKVPGSVELLGNGKYGILTEIKDTAGMAKAILSIANKEVVFNPESLIDHIRNHYSMDLMIDNNEKLFFG